MSRGVFFLAAFLVALLLAPATDADAQWRWPEKSENLQSLPADFPAQRLSAVMRGFTRALGVRCSHCHVGQEGEPLSTYDFASDENPNKDTARKMLGLLGDINEVLGTVEPSGPERVNMWCHTCHRGVARPMQLTEALMETYRASGIQAAVTQYGELRERYYGGAGYDFSERSLNGMGYELLGLEDHEAAIAIFRLNVEQYPESANLYDSLAEAYNAAGETELSAIYYQKALELDPTSASALEQLKALQSH